MGWEFSCPTLMELMGLVFFLVVSANETVGSSGATTPPAASVRVSPRDTPFSEAGVRPEWGAFGAVRSKFIFGLVRWVVHEREDLISCSVIRPGRSACTNE